MSFPIHPVEVDEKRRERAYRLAVIDIPPLRVMGMVLLSLAVLLNNRYLLGESSIEPWLKVTALFFAYCTLSWAALAFFYRRLLPWDLSLFFLAVDVVVWTIAIYAAGAERSWIFFIYLMRVADQTPTTFRRCLFFGLLCILCFAGMFAWVVLVDGRPVPLSVILVKIGFILLPSLYIAATARTAEARRRNTADAIHRSRESLLRLEEQSAELRDARERAEAANAAKSEFLTNMSHEMRTPLHAVLGMLQLARDDGSSPAQARQIELARRSAESLLGTIDDLLDFSKIEARKVDLEAELFSLREMLVETMEPLDVSAKSKGLRLTYEIEDDVPDVVSADPTRLRQVLTNLVGNAIKFTTSGGVDVRLSSESAEESRVAIRFDVHDTGIGIEPAKQVSIFQPFIQGDSSFSRRFGGAGLGLAIASRIVEAMGGRVQVFSQPGKGSTFTFTIRAELEPGAVPRRRTRSSGRLPAVTGQKMRILVAEDHPVNQEFAAEALRRLGHEVSVAADGAAALRLMSSERFDVVLMDVQMPLVDGLEVTRRYRASQPVDSHTRILALTAHSSREDRDRCLEAGMDEVLTKPLSVKQLAAALGAPEPQIGAILAAVGGNVQLLARVSEAFTKQTPPLITAMRAAIHNRDAIGLQRSAHTVKGAVLNFAGDPSIDLAKDVESAAKAEDFARAASIMPRLEAALRELEQKLAAAAR